MHRLPQPKLVPHMPVLMRKQQASALHATWGRIASSKNEYARTRRLDSERPWRLMNQRKRIEAHHWAVWPPRYEFGGPKWLGLTEATRRHVRR